MAIFCIVFNILRWFNQIAWQANMSVCRAWVGAVSADSLAICEGVVWDIEIGCAEGTSVQRFNLK
jgi:hypothetical protein